MGKAPVSPSVLILSFYVALTNKHAFFFIRDQYAPILRDVQVSVGVSEQRMEQ